MHIQFISKFTSEDIDYIQICEKHDDFKNYVSKSIWDTELYILRSQEANIGILSIVFDQYGDNKVAKPCIFLTIRMSRLSALSIIESVVYMFEILNTDIISFGVYRKNMSMKLLCENYNMKFNGIYKLQRKDSNEDLFYYSITKDMYNKFRKMKILNYG